MLRKLLKNIILLVNLLFVILLFVSGCASWLNPTEFTIIAILGLGFPIFIVINILFVLWWLFCRKMLFLVSLISLLPFVHRYIDFSANNKTTPQNGTTIRIMSYNAHNFGLHEQNNEDRHKVMQEMTDVINAQNLDIACFQEFSNNNTYFQVAKKLQSKRLKYKHTYYVNKAHDKYGYNVGLAIFSNYPIINTKNFLVEPTTVNTVIYCDIKINNDTIRVFNCHLQSNKFSDAEYRFIENVNGLKSDIYNKEKIKENRDEMLSVFRRMKDAYESRVKQAELLCEQIKLSPYSVVVCGDFNETQSSYVYNKIRKGLHDSNQLLHFGLGNTYRRFFPGIRIDYILYSSQLRCTSCKVLNYDGSDHRPVVGEYVVQ